MKIAFVVLHYKVASVTKECIDCLLRQEYDDFRIIVVDNCSDNGSYEEICETYRNETKVYPVSLERNYGFAKANDAGYLIAKHRFNAGIIAVINNDLMIRDPMFCQKTMASYMNTHFDIMGPDIINKANEHQNPQQMCLRSKKHVERMIRKTRIKLMLLPLLYGLYGLVKHGKDTGFHDNAESGELTQNVPLHGSCLIFGEDFVSKYEFPFYPDTFLYGEEDILFHLAQERKLTTVYDPSVVVYHMEDAATNSITKSSREKRMFELRNSLKSLKIMKALF